jgi:hypothetical protein
LTQYSEAFYSILKIEVIESFVFARYFKDKIIFRKHLDWNTKKRKNGELGRITSQQKVKSVSK